MTCCNCENPLPLWKGLNCHCRTLGSKVEKSAKIVNYDVKGFVNAKKNSDNSKVQSVY